MNRQSLLIGAALIVCATNVVALGLGWLNRHGGERGAMTLTERELPTTSADPESTATILRLAWTRLDDNGFPCEKIRPLGFTCLAQPRPSDSYEMRQPPRNGYVVLEYEGPAWEQVRKRHEAEAAELAARNPSASHYWAWNTESHLVAIDLGVDPGALRRAYPDESRYLITAARISARPSGMRDSQMTTLTGFVDMLLPSTINVPLPWSATINAATRAHLNQPPQSWRPTFTVTLRYGRFLEPWVVDVAATRATDEHGTIGPRMNTDQHGFRKPRTNSSVFSLLRFSQIAVGSS